MYSYSRYRSRFSERPVDDANQKGLITLMKGQAKANELARRRPEVGCFQRKKRHCHRQSDNFKIKLVMSLNLLLQVTPASKCTGQRPQKFGARHCPPLQSPHMAEKKHVSIKTYCRIDFLMSNN